MVEKRYESWEKIELAKKVKEGNANLEDFIQFVQQNGECKRESGKQELFENILNNYL